MSAVALGVPRHACHACGGCCHGAVVRLSPTEEARIEELGRTLGVTDPIVDGALRRESGSCVFLLADARCAIHARAGPSSKPAVCRQYPLLHVDDGAQGRVGVDPGCYSALLTGQHGPEVPVGSPAAVTSARWPEDVTRMEHALLTRAVPPGASLADALRAVLPPDTSLDGVLARWHALLRASALLALVRREDAGRALRDALSPVLAFVAEHPEPPLVPRLDPDDVRAVVGAARTFVFLRVSRALPPHIAMLLLLLGAVSCAQAARGDRVALARSLAGWSRALRAPPVLRALAPDEATLRHLVTGIA
jgi:hypothetical protein